MHALLRLLLSEKIMNMTVPCEDFCDTLDWLELEIGFVLYDKQRPEAWVQSDTVYSTAAWR